MVKHYNIQLIFEKKLGTTYLATETYIWIRKKKYLALNYQENLLISFSITTVIKSIYGNICVS